MFAKRAFGFAVPASLIVSAALLGPAVTQAQAASYPTICIGNGSDFCLNSPGAVGDYVKVVDAHAATFRPIDPSKWDGHDVAEQQIGAGPNCLTEPAWSGGGAVVEKCAGDKDQLYWWNPSNDELENVGEQTCLGISAWPPTNGEETIGFPCSQAFNQDEWASDDGVSGP